MPKSCRKPNSSHRRRALLESLGIGLETMRPCRNCSRASKQCRVGEDSEKCVECVRGGKLCDLAPLDTGRWKRLEEKRRKLKEELREAVAKQQRLLKQIDFVEGEQQGMIEDEFRNIDELEQSETSVPDPLIDVMSEQLVLPTLDGSWGSTSLAPFDGTLAQGLDIPSNSCKVPMCCPSHRSSSI